MTLLTPSHLSPTAALPLSIPSPSQGVWEVLGFPIRAYAICIIVGIAIAMLISQRRWHARGGTPDGLEAVIVVAIPFGIIGARIYHVITDYELYFGPGRNPVDALKIWNGGLGIWGAVALGALGAYLVARRRRIVFPALLDTLAPGLVIAQGVGRLGNWFNQELFGRPTSLPWALEIAPGYRPTGFEQYATFHPTFLYELIWDLLVAAVLIVADRRFRLGHGKVFALYVVLYTAGRFWIETLRIDRVNEIDGFRLNNYTAAIVFVLGLLWLLWLVRNRPGRETVVEGERGTTTGSSAEDGAEDGDKDKDEEEDGALPAGGVAAHALQTGSGADLHLVGDGEPDRHLDGDETDGDADGAVEDGAFEVGAVEDGAVEDGAVEDGAGPDDVDGTGEHEDQPVVRPAPGASTR